MRSQKLPLAGINDRVLSFFFDCVFIYPFIHFLLVPLLRSMNFHQQQILTGGGGLFYLLALVLVGWVFFFFFIFQVVSLYLFSATPGQKILRIGVISTDLLNFSSQRKSGPSRGGRPSLTTFQCLLRSFMFIFELVIMGLPFLEVFSHPLRSPLHDRAAETLVVSYKQEDSEEKDVQEAHWVPQFLSLAMLVFLVLWVTELQILYRSLVQDP